MRLGLMRFKYDHSGGAERSFGLLAEGLARRGHQVHAITTRWQGAVPEGVQVHHVPVSARGSAGEAVQWAARAGRMMDGLHLDSCLGLDRVPGAPVLRASDGCHAAWLRRRSKYASPFKRWSFKHNPKHRTLLDLERRTLYSPRLQRVIAISRMVKREFVDLLGVPADKITVIYNGVEEEALAPARSAQVREAARRELGLTDGRPALLFLGSGFNRKGLAFLINALAKLPEAVLLVAGKGKAGPYQAQARRLGIDQRVRFLGRRADVAELLAACDAMALPTIYDPLSVACLEAMYAGLPLVASAATGASELIEDRVSGKVVAEPGDVEELSAACAEALALPRGYKHKVPSREQWLSRTIAALEESAASGGLP